MRDRLVELLKETDKIRQEHNRTKDCYEFMCDETDCYTCDCGKRADYLLENAVIVPPLKMGDKVWIIDWCYEINSYEVTHIRYNKDLNGQRFSYDAIMVGKNGADIGFFDSDIGKYVFPTREEAEQALGKLQASCEQVKGGVQE